MPPPELTTRSATPEDAHALQLVRDGERIVGSLIVGCDGARRIDTMVLESNRPARELLPRAGYTRRSTWARWVKPIAHRAAGA